MAADIAVGHPGRERGGPASSHAGPTTGQAAEPRAGQSLDERLPAAEVLASQMREAG